jgi:DNA-3-methyladenine glycosylase II
MKRLIQEYGPPNFTPEKNYFRALLRAIIFQQLSGKAARTIFNRFRALFNSDQFPTPEGILAVDIQKLREVGLSGQKASYVRDLSEKWEPITAKLNNIDSLEDEEIRNTLLRVKGIGPWTVDMFLMFSLNRPDVFPGLDLGVRKGFQHLYGFSELPSIETLEQAAEKWRPYRTVAAWYLWKVVDGPFAW